MRYKWSVGVLFVGAIALLGCMGKSASFDPDYFDVESDCQSGSESLSRDISISNPHDDLVLRIRGESYQSGGMRFESSLPWIILGPGDVVEDTIDIRYPCENNYANGGYRIQACGAQRGGSLEDARLDDSGEPYDLDILDCAEVVHDGPELNVSVPESSSSGGSGGGCCVQCTTGKPCGDSCISQSDTCNAGAGCAC